jgi:hypothetical protein
MTGVRVAVACAVVGVASLLASGCGGGSSATTTTTSSTAAWADGLCSAIATWETELTTIGSSLKGGVPTKATLQQAVTKADDATKTLAQSVKSLGKPNTPSGTAARNAVDQLQTELTSGADAIKSAVTGVTDLSGALTAVSTVSTRLVTMGNQVTATVSKVQQLDVSGELGHALTQAPACKSLKGS